MSKNSKIFAMFPGQGSQFVGMGKSIVESFPSSKRVFEEASDAIGLDLFKLCSEGPDADLALTQNTQPCLVTVSIATWRVLQAETGLETQYFAGHSLGEYAALVAAQRLEFALAVRLVRERGKAMQNAVPVGVGSMAAVLFPDIGLIENACHEASTNSSVAQIANFNAPLQTVIAGHKEAVDLAMATLKKNGAKVIPLNVSAPFHSKLMAPAREHMTPLLESLQLLDAGTAFIPNLTGEMTRSYTPKFLIEQIDNPVLWTKSLATAESDQCTAYLEVGPGKVLSGLAKRTLKGEATIIDSNDLIETFKKLKEHGYT